MEKERLRDALEELRDALPTSTMTDTELAGYKVVLRDSDGQITDIQPLSRLRTLMYNTLLGNAYLIQQALKNRENDT